jgi:hypothetical protein
LPKSILTSPFVLEILARFPPARAGTLEKPKTKPPDEAAVFLTAAPAMLRMTA